MTWGRVMPALRRVRRSARRRAAAGGRGRGSWLMLLAGAVAVMVGLAGTLGGDGTRQIAATSASGQAATCAPTPERSGPLVDLSVDLEEGAGALTSGSGPTAAAGAGRVTSDAELAHLIGLAEQAGADVLSTSVGFDDIQPARRGPRDWSRLDRFVTAAEDAGLQVRVRLLGTASWALSPDRAGGPGRAPLGGWELARWAELVGDLAERYQDRLDYLEVWSGPDDFATWPTGPDPAAYAALLRTTYAATKAADPGVQVVTGGLSGNDLTYLEELYAVLDDTPGESRPFDLVGVEPYDGDRSPVVTDGPGDDRADDTLLGVRDLHRQMTDHGDTSSDVYVTGYGFRTRAWLGSAPVADTDRAAYLTEAFEVATCSPAVRVLSWYFQPSAERDASWTLLDDGLAPNQTYRALVAWSERVAALRGEAATR